MKRVNYFWYALVVMVLLVGCSDTETTDLQEEQIFSEFPPRPDIGPGESSVKSSSATKNAQKLEIAATGLATTDLNSQTVEELLAALISTGEDAPTISNITFVGASKAAGTFIGGTDIIGFESGIILSSGDINFVAGPNTADNTTANNGLPGDSDLDDLVTPYSTLDATVLEFDFECESTQVISFQYVFTSEEYNEYVNSAYNDVFAFFLNGENIALIPDSTTPVAINNVNCGNPYDPFAGTNCDLFINNDLEDGGGSVNTEMDGLTVVFNATGNLQPGLNHIKLVIADTQDRILDSNVFIKGESFVCSLPEAEVAVDIHPGSCPNPLGTKRAGLIPVAISGSADFDVNEINVSTLTLAGVSPKMLAIEDASTPYFVVDNEDLDEYDCHTLTSDGFYDLSLKFDAKEILSALGDVAFGDVLYLTLEGELNDGTPLVGGDVIIIK